MSCFHICTVALNCSQQVRMEIFNTDGSNISCFLTCQSTSTKSLCCMTVWCLYPAAHPYITLTSFLLCGVVCGSSAALWRPFYHTFILYLFWFFFYCIQIVDLVPSVVCFPNLCVCSDGICYSLNHSQKYMFGISFIQDVESALILPPGLYVALMEKEGYDES